MNKHRIVKIDIPFDGTYQQLDQLLMRIGRHSGGWLHTYPRCPKVFEFLNDSRLIWLPRQKRVEVIGDDPRLVEYMADCLTRQMKRHGFMDDPKKLKRRLRDLVLALSPPVTKRKIRAPRQTPRLASPQKTAGAKVKRGPAKPRKQRSRA